MKRSVLAVLVCLLALAGCGGGHKAKITQPAACPKGLYSTSVGCSRHAPGFGKPVPGLQLPSPTQRTVVQTLEMYDSVSVSPIPSNAAAVAGYLPGSAYPNFSQLVADFPHAYHVSITTTASVVAKCLDMEPGAASPWQAPGFYRMDVRAGVYHPCLYTDGSEMQSVLANMADAGIPRSDFLIWMAALTEHPGLVSGTNCTQWTFTRFGENLDESTCEVGFFATRPAPPPIICFGPHAQGNKTCQTVHADVRAWQKAVIESQGAYKARGCVQLVALRNKLSARWNWFAFKLKDHPQFKRAKREAALKATGRALNGVRRQISGLQCIVFLDRASFYQARITAIEKRYG